MLLDEQVFNFNEVMELEDAKQIYPDAAVVNTRMLMGQKAAEILVDDENMEYKGRMVAQGNWVQHVGGWQLFDNTEHYAPLDFSEGNLVVAHGLAHPKPGLRQGDVRGAYVKSDLKGRTILERIDKGFRPESWGRYKVILCVRFY